MNLFDFNRVMREELAKNEVLRLAGTGLAIRRPTRMPEPWLVPPLTTPSKNWQDYLKFNRTAKIQAFPVFVNDFEAQVKNKPTETEYQEIYKEGKDIIRVRGMISTQPAFMRPQTSNFEYLSINVDKIITEQMALVSEETLESGIRTPCQGKTVPGSNRTGSGSNTDRSNAARNYRPHSSSNNTCFGCDLLRPRR